MSAAVALFCFLWISLFAFEADAQAQEAHGGGLAAGAAQAEQRLVDTGPHAAAPDESARFFVGLLPGNVAQHVGRLKGASAMRRPGPRFPRRPGIPFL